MLDQHGFDLWAGGYDRAVGLSDEADAYPFAGYKRALGMIFRTVMQRENAAVLDIGFGTGTLTAKLYENGCRIYGQDFSQKMIEAASAKMPGAELYLHDFTEGLAEPLAQRSYDFIIATYSLHHLTDEQKIGFLRALSERLNPQGSILIGDVMFPTRRELEQCRRAAGESWDDEEVYFVVDELREHFPGLRYTQVSDCAGVLALDQLTEG